MFQYDLFPSINEYEDMLHEFEQAVAEKLDRKANIGLKYEPGSELAILRGKLIEEECRETLDELRKREALYFGTGTRAALAKELTDTLYVVIGTMVAYNLPMDECFRAVHENNMLKIANGTVNVDGKLVKAKDHPKVDLSGIVGEG